MSILPRLLAGGIAGAALLLGTAGAMADPGQATASVNVRSGPGTGYAVRDTLYPGEDVDIGRCTGGWCFVTHDGADGWVSANYLEGVDSGPIYEPAPVYVPPPIYINPGYVHRPYYPNRPHRPNFPGRPRPPGHAHPPGHGYPPGHVRPPHNNPPPQGGNICQTNPNLAFCKTGAPGLQLPIQKPNPGGGGHHNSP